MNTYKLRYPHKEGDPYLVIKTEGAESTYYSFKRKIDAFEAYNLCLLERSYEHRLAHQELYAGVTPAPEITSKKLTRIQQDLAHALGKALRRDIEEAVEIRQSEVLRSAGANH